MYNIFNKKNKFYMKFQLLRYINLIILFYFRFHFKKKLINLVAGNKLCSIL